MEHLRVCRFELDGASFGLPIESVREITPMAALARPPAIASIIEGFLNLRGVSLPVVRLAELVGLKSQALELHTPLVIVRSGEMLMALLVKRVNGLLTVPSNELRPIAKSDSFNGCVDATITSAGATVHLLSLNRLLLEKERQMLAEFQKVETARLAAIDRHPS